MGRAKNDADSPCKLLFSSEERAFALFVDFVLGGTAGNDLLLKSTLLKVAYRIRFSDPSTLVSIIKRCRITTLLSTC